MATIEGLYKLVLVDVRKSKVGSLQPDDFNIWINKAQRIVVDNKLASMDINTRHQDDLMPLRKKAVLTPVSDEIYAALPVDYLRTDALSVTLTQGVEEYKYVSCSYLSANRFTHIMRSHYDKPSLKLCYFNYGIETIAQKEKRVVYVYKPTEAVLTALNLSYYCEPATIEYSTENKDNVLIWNESMVNEIAQMCSLMYIASIGDPRVQTNMLIKQQTNSKQ
jgi:hypothetical protein